VPHVA